MPGVARVTEVSPPFNLGSHLADASMAIGSASGRLIAVAILTLLLLFGGEGLKRKVIAIGGERAQKKLTYNVIKAIDRQIEKYLVARALISGIVAAATWFGLWMLGVRQPLVLGLIAGALNIIPFIGPVVAVALATIVAFVQFHTIGMTAVVVGVTGAIAAVEGNLISPWLTGRAGELNTPPFSCRSSSGDGCGTSGDWCSPSRSWWRSRPPPITSSPCSLWESYSDGETISMADG